LNEAQRLNDLNYWNVWNWWNYWNRLLFWNLELLNPFGELRAGIEPLTGDSPGTIGTFGTAPPNGSDTRNRLKRKAEWPEFSLGTRVSD
jgi:hypothetical protein